MIVIVAKNVIKKDKTAEFIKLAKPLIEGSRNEEGCIEYALYEDIANNTVLTFVEKWKDQEAIDMHNNSSHFKNTVPKLHALHDAPAEVRLYKEV